MTMAVISFCGVGVAYGLDRDSIPELAICCASRITSKKYRVISLEGAFKELRPDFEPKPGQFVTGKAELHRVWDGSILVEFFGEELKILSNTNSTNFNRQLFKYI